MAVNDIEREVLELIDEDDYGVWEIGWRIATALGVDPNVDPREAAEAIASLHKRRLVDIYVREWPDAPVRLLDSSAQSLDLADPSAWQEPNPDEPVFLIGAPRDEGHAST